MSNESHVKRKAKNKLHLPPKNEWDACVYRRN